MPDGAWPTRPPDGSGSPFTTRIYWFSPDEVGQFEPVRTAAHLGRKVAGVLVRQVQARGHHLAHGHPQSPQLAGPSTG